LVLPWREDADDDDGSGDMTEDDDGGGPTSPLDWKLTML
jgi:hypothetical protein